MVSLLTRVKWGNIVLNMAVGLASSAYCDQTAPQEESDVGQHCFFQAFLSPYIKVIMASINP